MKKSKNKSKNKKLPAKKSTYYMILLSFFFIFIFLSSALIFNFSSFTNFTDTSLTGAVSAEGGNITYTNVSAAENAGFWQGYFGEITVDTSTSTPVATARGGNVTERNLILPCLGNEIYATTQNSINFGNIAAGTKGSVDIFLNLSSGHLESGSKVFTATRDFVVSSTLITGLPATYMKVSGSSDSTFALGVLNQSNVLVFLSNVSLDTVGFDGSTHDYQMMVPVNQSELTYYFFSDCEVVPPAPVPSPTPSAAARAGKSLLPIEEEKPITIGILEKEGKLLLTGYPIAITVLKGEKKAITIDVINIGEGELKNIYLLITGLPLDVFTIAPEKYALLSPGEKQAFLIEFQGNLEAETYAIEVVVVSDQGSSFIEGILIVKDLPSEQKLPLAGAAAGLTGKYDNILLLFLLLLILLLLGIVLWHFLVKTRGEAYHTCTVEDLLHYHEENDRIKVMGKIKLLGKSKEVYFSRLEDKTGWIDVFTDMPLRGKVEIKGIVQRDAEKHKYIKAISIKELLRKNLKKKRA